MRSKLEVTEVDTRPPPPGGVYGYEHQRIAMAALDRDRMEPYAAFSGSEFVTLAVEGLLIEVSRRRGRGMRSPISSGARRSRCARRSRRARSAQYCVQQPGYGVGIEICSDKIRP